MATSFVTLSLVFEFQCNGQCLFLWIVRGQLRRQHFDPDPQPTQEQIRCSSTIGQFTQPDPTATEAIPVGDELC